MAYVYACCAVDLLGWAADRGDGGGVVPQARAARGGRQGARLLQEHQRHGVRVRASASCLQRIYSYYVHMKREAAADLPELTSLRV